MLTSAIIDVNYAVRKNVINVYQLNLQDVNNVKKDYSLIMENVFNHAPSVHSQTNSTSVKNVTKTAKTVKITLPALNANLLSL